MKKIILMLAFCGALATMSAQTEYPGYDPTNSPRTGQEDEFTPEKKSNAQVYPNDQNQVSPKGTEQNKNKTVQHNVKGSKTHSAGSMASHRSKSAKKNADKTALKLKTGMSTPTPIPVAEDKTAVIPPDKVRESYNNQHNAAHATWKKEGENYLASFKTGKGKDALETIVVYDKEGKVILTEQELASNSCPSDISKYCHSMTGSRIWEVDAKSEPRKYFIQESGETKWYDASGNRISGPGSGTKNMVHHRTFK